MRADGAGGLPARLEQVITVRAWPCRANQSRCVSTGLAVAM